MVVCHDEQLSLIFTDNDAGAAALCVLLVCAKHRGDAPVGDGDYAGKAVVCDGGHICGAAVIVEGIGGIQGIRRRRE